MPLQQPDRIVVATVSLRVSPEEHEQCADEIAFAHAGLSVLYRAITSGRALVERDGQLHALLGAVHNIPAAIENPDSYFGIYGDGHRQLRRGFKEYDVNWPGRPFRGDLTTCFDTALADAVEDSCCSRAVIHAECSLLLPGNTPLAHPEIEQWARAATSRAREVLTGLHPSAGLRAFRWPQSDPSHNILELSFSDELGNSHAITFTAGYAHTFHVEEPDVPDLVEALHMAGIVIRMLGVSVSVGDLDAFERARETS